MPNVLRVSQRDIAQRYGCSCATVSLALNGNPRIRPEIRREIALLAERMGYRPDPDLTRLARDRFARRPADYRANLAYLYHSNGGVALQLRHFDAARERAEVNGYRVEKFDLAEYSTGGALAKVLRTRNIRGVILSAMQPDAERYLVGPEWEEFTFVCCSIGWARFVYNVVQSDVLAGTRLAWTRVHARGYRRIGAAMFRHSPIAEDDYARHGGSVAAQDVLIPKKDRIPILVDCDVHDRETFLKWFRRNKPDVVISFISRAYDWLVEAGYRVPDDVAFACLNVHAHEHFSGVRIMDVAMAEAAVDSLISQLQQNERGIPVLQKAVLLEPEWLEGDTLPQMER